MFSFLWGTLAMSPVRAVTVDDIYRADVLVTDESGTQLRTGARAGLLQVLIRVSGRPDVEDSSLIRSALRNPSAYYYQFSYESTDRRLLVGDRLVPAVQLRVNFEPSAVARLLRDAGFPVWGSNRPGVMIWIALGAGADRQILGEDDIHPVLDSLRDQARLRGIPLILPIMDIEDAARISVAEVWGGFFDRIEAASGRYTPDVLVSARVQEESGDSWSGKWSIAIDGRWRSVESRALSADEVVRQMVDELANELAARYALGSSRGTLRVVVENVKGLEDYAALASYLEQMTPVVSSSIVLLDGD
ncbi:MAG: DUF2066 domain-containing protein, partial [Proteobacteria bacterium]|nr:DUF2066 domain-containing protein [Pseudomonadota bacterium]